MIEKMNSRMNNKMAWALASLFLQYPNSELIAEADRYRKLAASIDPKIGGPLGKFIDEICQLPVSSLQEHYVENFDMRRKFSLFLTSWTHGDTRNRGMAMVYFIEKYKKSNLNLKANELPDHLAVVLEFAAHHNDTEGELMLAEHQAPIELIYSSLTNISSPYQYVLKSILATLPETTPEILARTKALALNGPPKEFVGLAGEVAIALQPFSPSASHQLEGSLK